MFILIHQPNDQIHVETSLSYRPWHNWFTVIRTELIGTKKKVQMCILS